MVLLFTRDERDGAHKITKIPLDGCPPSHDCPGQGPDLPLMAQPERARSGINGMVIGNFSSWIWKMWPGRTSRLGSGQPTARESLKMGRMSELTINATTTPMTSSMAGSIRRAIRLSWFSSSRS